MFMHSCCWQLDPTPPPALPSIKLTAVTPPEYFNQFPDYHTLVGVYRSFNNVSTVPACQSTQTYNFNTGRYSTRICRYGVYSQISMVIIPSATSTPSPRVSHFRNMYPGYQY